MAEKKEIEKPYFHPISQGSYKSLEKLREKLDWDKYNDRIYWEIG